MNIALIMHELLVEGGGERQCVSLARELARQGHQIKVYTSAYDPSNCFPEICQEVTVIEIGRGRWPKLRKPTFLRGYLDMKHLARAVRERHEIWNPHHWPAQWGALWLKQKLGGTVLWMCNDVPTFFDISQNASGGWINRAVHHFFYLYDRAQNRKIDLTMFLSNWAESEFTKIYPATTCVVRSGADPERFSPGGNRQKIRERFGYKQEEFVLLWLGIFMPHRRLQDAIEAIGILASRGARIRLLLAGSGRSFPEYFQSLQELAANLGVKELVTFAGKVENDEIRDFYCACDAFLFPNENQTWGLAVLEAMACGRPVLVSRGAAVHEVLTDNENAYLFSARTPAQLAEKIQYLIEQPEERNRAAQAGMELVRTKYNWKEFARQVSRICQTLLKRQTD